MGVFLTLHHEEMCLLDVYVQSKRQDNINVRNPLQRLKFYSDWKKSMGQSYQSYHTVFLKNNSVRTKRFLTLPLSHKDNLLYLLKIMCVCTVLTSKSESWNTDTKSGFFTQLPFTGCWVKWNLLLCENSPGWKFLSLIALKQITVTRFSSLELICVKPNLTCMARKHLMLNALLLRQDVNL